LTIALDILCGWAVNDLDKSLFEAAIMRCGNAAHGDFQCNNALGLAKALKTAPGYAGPKSPKDIADAIIKQVPANNLIESCSAAVS
jgi:arginyl-tRNA synthetase